MPTVHGATVLSRLAVPLAAFDQKRTFARSEIRFGTFDWSVSSIKQEAYSTSTGAIVDETSPCGLTITAQLWRSLSDCFGCCP